MNFTLQQLTRIVQENPESTIYFHPNKTWWTHTLDDFYRLTDEQFNEQMTRLQAVVDGQDYPEENRNKAKALIEQAQKVRDSGAAIPMAPDQSPLQIMTVERFLHINMSRASRLGRFGVINMMHAHAQNCSGVVADKLSEFDLVSERYATMNYEWIADLENLRKALYKATESKLSKEQIEQGYRPRIIPMTAASHKIGRNDKCPCGSGKKYKQCHGQEA